MGNNSVPKFIFRLSRFPVYRGSVLGRFYCMYIYMYVCVCVCVCVCKLRKMVKGNSGYPPYEQCIMLIFNLYDSIFEIFYKICRNSPVLVQIGQT